MGGGTLAPLRRREGGEGDHKNTEGKLFGFCQIDRKIYWRGEEKKEADQGSTRLHANSFLRRGTKNKNKTMSDL